MKHILLIEDNNEIRENTAEILQLAGYSVVTAENGKRGIELAMEKKPDVIICDVMMPVLDGYAASKRIRHELKLTVPIIAMTANALPGERERCIQAGMNDYITKPFKPQVLINAVTGMLNQPVIERETSERVPEQGALLDLNNLREFSIGSGGFMQELVEIFLQQNPKDLHALSLAIAAEDYARIRSILHTMHSSLGVLGFPQYVLTELRSGQLRNVPERAGRATDAEDEGGLETLRREGHM